jgi:membrane-associated phospholipid phosphatase
MILGAIEMKTVSQYIPYVRHLTLRIIILLLVMLCCPAIDVPVQATDGIEKVGDALMIALPVVAAGLTIGLKDGQGAFQLGESAALTVGVTYGLKFAVDEKRPNGDDQSFPSLHASISFMSAEFMRKRYGWEYGIPAYLVATFVAYSRVEADEHYTHDVIAGAAVGIGSSFLFTKPYKGWHVQPDVDHAYHGIRFSHSW